jgi:SNF2-related domain
LLEDFFPVISSGFSFVNHFDRLMGRSKSQPTQRQANDDTNRVSEPLQEHVPFLGRRALFSTERQHLSSVIDTLFSDDSDSDSYQGRLQSMHSGGGLPLLPSERNSADADSVDPFLDDDVPNEGGSTGVSHTRINSQERNQRKRRRPSDSQCNPPSSSRNAFASIVQRIEQEESVKQQYRQLKKQKAKKYPQNDTLPTVKISFASDAIVIPPSEIQIVQLDSVVDDDIVDSMSIAENPADYNNTQSIETLSKSKVSDNICFIGVFNSRQGIETGTHRCEDEVVGWLCDYPLPSSFQLQFSVVSTQVGSSSTVTLPIVTKQGAIDVWSFLLIYVLDGETAIKERSECQIGLQALGRSVEVGSVRLELCIDGYIVRNSVEDEASKMVGASSTNVRMRIGLTDRAMRLCQNEQIGISSKFRAKPSSLSSVFSKGKAKKCRQRQAARSPSITSNSSQVCDIHVTLALVFPMSEIADVWGSSKDESQYVGQTITAKHIYSLVDNVQLKESLQHDNATSTLTVSGLVPTLRPYQCKAVEWMIHREKQHDFQYCNRSSGDEWELAWLVLSSSSAITANTCLAVRSPLSLTIWKQNNPSCEDNLMLFCPYTGWLANSLRQARELTIGKSSRTTKGGILAESMGLGKTVEVLACILANPLVGSSGSLSSGVKRKFNVS